MADIVNITSNDLEFTCLVEGDKDNPLVLFLHGFPETAFMWRNLIRDVAAKNFYCVAPNLRGFSHGACPRGKKHYRLHNLATDITGIALALGYHQFHLIGHDWGSAIGWKVAHDHPDKILSWTALSVPHLQAFGAAIVNDPQQRKMSSYIKSFQLPILPERAIRKDNFALFRKLWASSAEEEIAAYLAVFKNKAQLTATLNYYRSNYRLLKMAAKTEILGDIEVPTLFIWGKDDMAIGETAVEDSHKYVKTDYQFLELDAGHWLIQTRYSVIKEAFINHLLAYEKASVT